METRESTPAELEEMYQYTLAYVRASQEDLRDFVRKVPDRESAEQYIYCNAHLKPEWRGFRFPHVRDAFKRALKEVGSIITQAKESYTDTEERTPAELESMYQFTLAQVRSDEKAMRITVRNAPNVETAAKLVTQVLILSPEYYGFSRIHIEAALLRAMKEVLYHTSDQERHPTAAKIGGALGKLFGRMRR